MYYDEFEGMEEEQVAAPMTQGEVKERLRKYLRMKSVPPKLWRYLVYERFVQTAIAGEDPKCRYLCREASAELHRWSQRKRRSRAKTDSQSIDVGPLLDPREAKREEVLSHELARLAMHLGAVPGEDDKWLIPPEVPAFREDFLGGTVLTDFQAWKLLRSPLLALCEWPLPGGSDIPITDHEARIVSRQKELDSADPPSFVCERILIEIEWPGGHHETSTTIDRSTEFLDLRYRGSRGRPDQLRVLPKSLLGRLHELSCRLAEHYRWDTASATQFVLTGKVPATPCLSAEVASHFGSDHLQMRVNLSIQPWTSARTVYRIYKHLQSQILRQENRHLRIDSLEFLDFVAERRHAGLSWRPIMEQWNKVHPKERYKADDLRNFQRDFQETSRLLLEPAYHPFSTPERAKQEGDL
ncbi:MAG: hypothetical protein FJY88_05325 [Candidatus Eisenbacteria bacterium]|nr:hypothetical protein [Candidatus Eisenbacteria bacterium]